MVKFFELKTYDKKENNNRVSVLFQVVQIKLKYTSQINIVGNSRTFDHVIRRKLEIVEGDAVNDSQIKNIKDTLISLNLLNPLTYKRRSR